MYIEKLRITYIKEEELNIEKRRRTQNFNEILKTFRIVSYLEKRRRVEHRKFENNLQKRRRVEHREKKRKSEKFTNLHRNNEDKNITLAVQHTEFLRTY